MMVLKKNLKEVHYRLRYVVIYVYLCNKCVKLLSRRKIV